MFNSPQYHRIADIPRHWARLRPQSAAVWEDGRPLSFGWLQQAIARVAELLRARGVGPGDRVAIVAENCAAEVALLFAASELGAWPVIVNARLSPREIADICQHCEPRLEVFTVGRSSEARAHADRRQAVDCTDDLLGEIAFGPTAEHAKPESGEVAARVATLIYTSGTTGAPKGVMTTHEGLLHFCAVSVVTRQLRPEDIVYAALPLSHIFGIATILLSSLAAGASVYLEPRFTPETCLSALGQHRVSILQGVPTLFNRLLAYLQEKDIQPFHPALRYLYAGGGSLDPTLKQRLEAAFGLPLHHGYGMTEYAGSMFMTRIERPRSDCSPGELNPGCEVTIQPITGEGRGSHGEVWVRGPGNMLGYYRTPELTEAALTKGGWLRTGDLGYLAADGALRIVGRSKDMIKRSGFAIYPLEIESEANRHPAVKLSAAVGIPSSEQGEEDIVVFVEAHAGSPVDAGELMQFLKDRLAAYKRPQRIVPVAAIPLTANGKIRKHELKALLRSAEVG